mmetsp:Transcript_42295/g.51327  ORF Transcript_42295/g.51327 Transcript_42295/m.51327 type:complete len:328 (+) Transcript_42295:210-1193(+)
MLSGTVSIHHVKRVHGINHVAESRVGAISSSYPKETANSTVFCGTISQRSTLSNQRQGLSTCSCAIYNKGWSTCKSGLCSRKNSSAARRASIVTAANEDGLWLDNFKEPAAPKVTYPRNSLDLPGPFVSTSPRRPGRSDEFDFESWQIVRLEQAFQRGRKQISVLQLAGDVRLSRGAVLSWLKERENRPELAAKAQKRVEALRKRDAARSAAPPQRPTDGGDYYFWRQDWHERKLSKKAKDALNRVFLETHYPDDEMIDLLAKDVLKLPRRRVVGWFVNARKAHEEEKAAREAEWEASTGRTGRTGRRQRMVDEPAPMAWDLNESSD